MLILSSHSLSHRYLSKLGIRALLIISLHWKLTTCTLHSNNCKLELYTIDWLAMFVIDSIIYKSITYCKFNAVGILYRTIGRYSRFRRDEWQQQQQDCSYFSIQEPCYQSPVDAHDFSLLFTSGGRSD